MSLIRSPCRTLPTPMLACPSQPHLNPEKHYDLRTGTSHSETNTSPAVKPLSFSAHTAAPNQPSRIKSPRKTAPRSSPSPVANTVTDPVGSSAIPRVYRSLNCIASGIARTVGRLVYRDAMMRRSRLDLRAGRWGGLRSGTLIFLLRMRLRLMGRGRRRRILR